jgi:hypothetical protein
VMVSGMRRFVVVEGDCSSIFTLLLVGSAPTRKLSELTKREINKKIIYLSPRERSYLLFK